MRFILYARASTKDKQNPDHQLAELRAEAARRGWSVVREIVERESGRKDDRPEWTAALDSALAGGADGIAAVELSRFGRSTQHLLEVSTALRTAGRHLVCTRQSEIDTTTPIGRMLFTILAAVAEFEADLVRERVRAGVAYARAKRGGAWGRPAAALGAEALELAAARIGEGTPLRAISAELAEMGFLQPELWRAGVRVRGMRPWPIGTIAAAVARVRIPPSKPAP